MGLQCLLVWRRRDLRLHWRFGNRVFLGDRFARGDNQTLGFGDPGFFLVLRVITGNWRRTNYRLRLMFGSEEKEKTEGKKPDRNPQADDPMNLASQTHHK